MEESWYRVVDAIRLYVAARIETVLRPEMSDDAVVRAWRMAGYYRVLKDLPGDEEASALLQVVAPYLDRASDIPDPDSFRRIVEFAHDATSWNDWRDVVTKRLRVHRDELLAVARRIYQSGQFDIPAFVELALAGELCFPLNEIFDVYEGNAIEVRESIREEMEQLIRLWYRRRSPLLRRVSDDVYYPSAEFNSLFEDEPLLPDPPWMTTATGVL